MSQSAFAGLIGRSTPTVQAIENGRLAVSADLEAAIFVETGADIREMKKGKKGKALDQNGQQYSSEFYKSWKNRKENYDSTAALTDFDALVADASRLGKLSEVLVAAQEWFFRVRTILSEAEVEPKSDAPEGV
jgi:transcriptional regulator with XRE-family HTH domain